MNVQDAAFIFECFVRSTFVRVAANCFEMFAIFSSVVCDSVVSTILRLFFWV